MASTVTIFFFVLVISISVSCLPSLYAAENSLIQEACTASRDPPTCLSTITQSGYVPPNPTILDIIQSVLEVSDDGIKKAALMVTDILSQSTGNLNRTNAAKTCLEVLNYADYRINLTAAALPNGEIKDARAFVGAAMAYEYDCWSALRYVNGTSQVNETMSFLFGLIGSSSDAAAMIVNLDNFANQTSSWGPVKTERDGFWETAVGGSIGSPFTGDVPAGLTPDVSVCLSQSCQFTTVQDAVNAAPDNGSGRFVIYIKTGVYQETVRVPLEKKNVVFLGDGMGKTVITGSLNADQPGMSTFNSATVGVVGDGFMASNLTIQNTANAHQAVAFRSDSDHSIIQNCEFLGNQDTLYVHTLRQYYKSCRIQGNIDFIFGNSATFFQDCIILISPRLNQPEHGETNTITAHGRIDPAQSTGFVFNNCLINGTDEYMGLYYSKPSVHENYLGRPWKEYSRTVFINCTLEALIRGEGWLPWDGDFALQTLYYGEFENTGRGANITGRVSWSNQIPAQHVDSYSVQNFIQELWVRPVSDTDFEMIGKGNKEKIRIMIFIQIWIMLCLIS